MIRVGYDGSSGLLGHGGIPRYVRELFFAMAALKPQDIEFTLLLNSMTKGGADFPIPKGANVRVIRRRIPGPLLLEGWRRLQQPAFETVASSRCDVVHSPSGYIPAARCPVVVTVHDLHFLNPAAAKARYAGAYLQETYAKKLARQKGLITPSRYVARQVRELYGISSSKVHPIYHGLRSAFVKSDYLTRRVDKILVITDQRIPRKRADLVPAILQQLALQEKIATEEERVRVELFGSFNRKTIPSIPKFLVRGLAGVGVRSDYDLARLYRSARVVVIPSEEEGFGFPLLETLAAGTPVVCGRHSALEEIGGPGTFFVDELKPELFAARICDAWESAHDPNLQSAAHHHALRFSWKRAASKTLAVYRKIALSK